MLTKQKRSAFPWTTATWSSVAAVSVALWIIASQGSLQRGVLLVGLSLSSFMVGCLVGFLFTSYGEEVGTVGKVRDWLIGGIAGLTVAKAGSVKALLDRFAIGQNPSEFPLMVSAAMFYVGLGFFFMFFQRELILNVVLAEKRSERVRLEGSRQAEQVIQHFLSRLPASMLSGVESINEISDVNEPEAEDLKKSLYSEDVDDFLEQAEGTAKTGSLDWDIISKTAYIYYYRTYFQKDPAKYVAVGKALEWINRALNTNPLHVDLTMKYADMLGANDETVAAVAILERLLIRPEAPVLVSKWLGFYLLYLPGRETDSIRYSQRYLDQFAEDADARFNIACAYAQLYCEELKDRGKSNDSTSINREKALEFLQEALTRDPDYREIVATEWTKKDESFECLSLDSDFQHLVGKS